MKKKDINIKHTNEILPHAENFKPQEKDLFNVFETFDKQKISNYVIKQVIKHKVPMFTIGTQGEIYKVALPYEGGEKYFLVAKKKRDRLDQTYDLRDEFRLQHEVYDTVKHPIVKVPELFGYQELPNGEQFIVMEFIPGQTLYTLLLNKVVEKNNPKKSPAQNDREVDVNILEIFGIESTKTMIAKLSTTPHLYSEIKWMKLFTQEQAKHIKKNIQEFLNDMHVKGIYHTDLGGNLKNIMFCPDGTIYIIDFGRAIKKDILENKKDIYKQEKGQGTQEYYADEDILDIIDAYTEKN